MKKSLFVLSAVMTMLFFTFSVGAAAESDSVQGQLLFAQVKQLTPIPVQTTSQNVTKALQVIMAAVTYSDVINAFKAITMSSAEIEQFKLAVAKEPYASKIAQLNQQKATAVAQTTKQVSIDMNPFIARQVQIQQTRLQATTSQTQTFVQTALTSSLQTSSSLKVAIGAPTITALSRNDIAPGMIIGIQGSNFGTTMGTVAFKFGVQTISGFVMSWQDFVIQVQLPAGISGLEGVAGSVSVNRRDSSFTAAKTIAFIPDLDFETIRSLNDFCQITSTQNAFLDLTNSIFNNCPCTGDFRYRFISPSGNLDYLRNSWIIESASFACRDTFEKDCGDNFSEPAKSPAGSNGFIPAGNRNWTTFGSCNGSVSYRAYEELVIKGPKGLKYY